MKYRVTPMTINGVLIEQLPIPAEDTGIAMKRLISFVMRNLPEDPIGMWADKELFVYNDWRLRALQEREGVPVTPEPSSMTVVAVIH